MNIGAITKVLFSCSSATPAPLRKHYICKLPTLTRYFQLLSKISAAPPVHIMEDLGKQAPYHVTCSNLRTNQEKQNATDYKKNPSTIWEDVKQMNFTPFPTLILGLSGMIPFAFPPAYMIMAQTFSTKLAFAQNVYGACVMSYLGGVRLGYVMPEGSPQKPNWFNMGQSVFPPLVAWTALMLPQTAATLTIMGGVAGATYIDTAVKALPPWYKGLRFILSIGVLLSLWTVLLCKVTLIPPTDSELNAVNKIGGILSLRAEECSEENLKVEECFVENQAAEKSERGNE